MPEKSERPKFRAGETAGEVLIVWWRELADRRGERADLRRTVKSVEVILIPAYHRLRVRLLTAGYIINNERLAVIAGLAARVKENSTTDSVARQMARVKTGTSPQVAELRFRRILETDSTEELFPILNRALSLLGNSVNLLDLADSIYGWNDYQKKRWALEYYPSLPDKVSRKRD